MHRAKGDRRVRASVLNVCDNAGEYVLVASCLRKCVCHANDNCADNFVTDSPDISPGNVHIHVRRRSIQLNYFVYLSKRKRDYYQVGLSFTFFKRWMTDLVSAFSDRKKDPTNAYKNIFLCLKSAFLHEVECAPNPIENSALTSACKILIIRKIKNP